LDAGPVAIEERGGDQADQKGERREREKRKSFSFSFLNFSKVFSNGF
jgi:hypothetical protein